MAVWAHLDKKTAGRVLLKVRPATVALMAFCLSGCVFGSGSENLYEPGGIHVEARQQVLSENVSVVDERSRELKERFNALERLYVDLIRQSNDQSARLSDIEARIDRVSGTSASAASITQLSDEITKLQGALKQTEERLFSIELNGVATMRSEAFDPSAAAAEDAPEEAEMVPTVAEPTGPQYGVHLGSYRAMDQVPGSWTAFKRVFVDELGGLDPRVYTQTQDGIGNFMRLIAGPLETMADAESLCRLIKGRAREQYCEATEFQGEPLN